MAQRGEARCCYKSGPGTDADHHSFPKLCSIRINNNNLETTAMDYHTRAGNKTCQDEKRPAEEKKVESHDVHDVPESHEHEAHEDKAEEHSDSTTKTHSTSYTE